MSELPVSWVAPGQFAYVGEIDLSGAMVYVGTGSDTVRIEVPIGPSRDPSLIDPTLPIHRATSYPGLESYYLQSYRALSPEDRGAYLEWLAGGREAPDALRSFIRLFMAGLERRLFVDILADPTLRWEIPFIRSVLVALQETYRTRMYQGFTDRLLEMIDHMEVRPATVDLTPPPLIGSAWDTPLDLKIGLGSFTAQRMPIPAGWAVCWAWFRPDVPLRTSALRCTEEFAELFKILYRAQYGEGIILRQGKKKLSIPYAPANTTIGQVNLDLGDIPDVFLRPGAGVQLRELANKTSLRLDSYSRWLARNPDDAGTLASLAYLPPELVNESRPAVSELRKWVDERMGDRELMIVPASDLVSFWSVTPIPKLTRRETIAFAGILGRFGIGMEPDPRFGRATLDPSGSAVLFRSDDPISEAPPPGYLAARLAAHLAVAVLDVDAPLTAEIMARLIAHLKTATALGADDARRLHAHLLIQLDRGVTLTGLRSQADQLDADARRHAGDIVISVAARECMVAPPTVVVVTKIFCLLGLDRDLVPSQLYAAMTSSPPIAATTTKRRPAKSTHVVLDREMIRARQTESESVSSLLGIIFADDAGETTARSLLPDTGTVEAVGTLDGPHVSVLQALASRESWSAGDFVALAARNHLLPEATIDVLNEAAFDLTGDPLIEGDDPLIINPDILQELLS